MKGSIVKPKNITELSLEMPTAEESLILNSMSITLKGTKVLISGNADVETPNHIADKIKAMINTKEWKEHVDKLNSDPDYLAKELERLDDEFNEEHGNDSQ